jgi:hypothetical protein
MNDEKHDDRYLWDGSGAPDPEVAALESELARHRWSGRLPQDALPARAPRRRVPLSLAAGLLAAAVLAGGLWLRSRDGAPAAAEGPVYRAEALEGAVAGGDLRAGDRLVTDAVTRARVGIGELGSVVVEPGSTLRFERPGPDLAHDAEHLLWLERGAITASIFAAPRLFQLGTPSGLAVDLGCVYTARVHEDGSTQLTVVAGQVSFETEQRRVTVPSGASTLAVPGLGPATPTWDDAPEAWRAAVAQLDHLVASGGAGADALLDRVLATDEPDDSLTLWHLLAWPALPEAARARVAQRLAQLVPPPQEAGLDACLALDATALEAWRGALGWSW